MTLRVGDKVKVIKMLRPSESFEVGETGKVVGIYEYCNNYPISVRMDKDKEIIDFSKEELELYKEDKMEKNFKEVIRDIKEGEVWCAEIIRIEKTNNSIRIHIGVDVDILEYTDDFRKFKLQRKEYTFEEAFAAYEEGKEIESCFSHQKFKVYSWEDIFNSKEIKEMWYINE